MATFTESTLVSCAFTAVAVKENASMTNSFRVWFIDLKITEINLINDTFYKKVPPTVLLGGLLTLSKIAQNFQHTLCCLLFRVDPIYQFAIFIFFNDHVFG